MEYLVILAIILLSSTGNRMRGTGVLKHITTLNLYNIKYVPNIVHINLCGSHIYGLFIALVIGLVFNDLLLGLSIFIAYIIGESKGWGEWVGSLTRTEPFTDEVLEFCYKDNEGKTFPFIHQIANAITKEQTTGTLEQRTKKYKEYAEVALTLRGLYWWLPLYIIIAMFGYIDYDSALWIGILLAVSFPIACEISKHITFTRKFGILSFSTGWENQEFIYGAFQGIALSYVVISYLGY